MEHAPRTRIVVLLTTMLVLLVILAREQGWTQQPILPPLFVSGENISVNAKGTKWTYRALRIGWAQGHHDKREVESILRRGEDEVIRIPEYGKASLFLRWYDLYPDPQSLEEFATGAILGFGKLHFTMRTEFKAFGKSRTGDNDEFGFLSHGGCSWEADEDEEGEYNCQDIFNWVAWLEHGLPRAVTVSRDAEESEQIETINIATLTTGVYILTLTLQAEGALAKQRYFPVAVGKVSEKELQLAQAEARRLARGITREHYAGLALETGPASGVASLEQLATFNVLDEVIYDPRLNQFTLLGHTDLNYAGPPIPYLSHLAELLENPAPEFSLEWTPESERRVDDFMARMDSDVEYRKMVDSFTQGWLDDKGTPTAIGRIMFPLLGVSPTDNNKGAGYLGAQISLDARKALVLGTIKPGSPAEAAGLRYGDEIILVNNRQVFHPGEFARQVRRTGAGGVITLHISRPGYRGGPIGIELGESETDAWEHMDRFEMLVIMLDRAGMKEQSRLMDVYRRLQKYGNSPVMQNIFTDLLFVTGNLENQQRLSAQMQRGELTQAQVISRMHRNLLQSTDRILGLNVLTPKFDQAIRQRYSSDVAFDKAYMSLNTQLEPIMRKAMQANLRKHDVIAMPVSAVGAALRFRPQVAPEFHGIEPGSALALAMFKADYLAKSMVHNTALEKRIPGYKTLYSFERVGGRKGASRTITERMWISIESLDVAQSENGYTLQTRDAHMRFNIRGIGNRATSAPYADFLTARYDELSQQLPVLHELREAAKLVGVAQWLRQHNPNFRLPKSPPAWEPPSTIPGTVYLNWSPQPGVNTVSMMAMGGISFDFNVPPIGPSGPVDYVQGRPRFPVDTSVVDLSGLETARKPVILNYERPALSKSLRRPYTIPPVPRPPAWVARHKKGQTVLRMLTVRANEAGQCPAVEAAGLGKELEHAQRIARQLSTVENAINTITDQSPERQAKFAGFEQDLLAARDEFIESSFDIISQGLFSTYKSMHDTRLAKRFGPAREVADVLLENKDALDNFKGKLDEYQRYKTIYDGFTRDDIAARQQAANKLIEIAIELGEEIDKNKSLVTNPAAKQALGALNKSLGYAKSLKSVYTLGKSLVTLSSTAKKVEQLGKQTEQELANLTKQLLPMKRDLSDELDSAMQTRAIQNWLSGRNDC